MNKPFQFLAFLLGLAAIGWVGTGYLGANPVALGIVVLIAAFYAMGGAELRRFQQATQTLEAAVTDLPAAPPELRPWLDRLHPSLRQAVRQRVEGERVALPGPAMTPYLAGLLVLLGMLGTFLGMVVTLKGTGAALDNASDLAAMRASLSAPVKGLGLAFGTSVAGVAASAMLGLVSALCRRDRMHAAWLLDARIGTTLRGFSLVHRREETFRLMQQQAQAVPVLVDRLETMMTTLERQHQALHDRLAGGQDRFHGQAEAAYVGLAASVNRSLKESLDQGARVAAATIQPVVEATMAGIAREASALHRQLDEHFQRQLDGLAERFQASGATVAGLWESALADHRAASRALDDGLRDTLGRFTQTFAQRSDALVDGVSARLDSLAARIADAWDGALAEQTRVGDELGRQTRTSLAATVDGLDRHSVALLQTVNDAGARLHAEAAERDAKRLADFSRSFDALGNALVRQWADHGTANDRQQREICDTLARTALDLAERTQGHARETIAEIERLAGLASDAPRAANELIGAMRSQLEERARRDDATLEERARLAQALATVLETLNTASHGQQASVEALVAASTRLLEQVGSRFAEKVDAGTRDLASLTAQVSGSAVEVASLGEAFGHAVELFGQSNDKLVAHLQGIEAALGQSMARSDEQLAYYVTQAREVIDLSISSQRQIVEDLQRLADRAAPVASEA